MMMIGTVIKNKYKIMGELGAGSMATVYLALDQRTKQISAIKILHPHIANDGQFLDRFRREAEILLSFTDSRIIKLYDYGVDPTNNVNFMVMEFVEGKTLKEVITEEGPLPLERGLNLAQQIAEGLQAAFEHNVVHRDIKPQNIMETTGGLVKIMDFGMAKGASSAALTSSGIFMGTAAYIAPEQADNSKAADVRSDLYSLGAVIYELMTGRVPFEGASAIDIVLKHLQEPVPLVRDSRSDVPPELDALIAKAMAKDPKDRYQTPGELANALTIVQQLGQGNNFSVEDAEKFNDSPQPIPPPPPPPPKYKPLPVAALVAVKTDRAFLLKGTKMVVGRSDPAKNWLPDIDLSLADVGRTISRRHAEILVNGTSYQVQDKKSANGTFLNDKKLDPDDPKPLTSGDHLCFGELEVRFEVK